MIMVKIFSFLKNLFNPSIVVAFLDAFFVFLLRPVARPFATVGVA